MMIGVCLFFRHQEHFGEFGIYKCNISDTSGYLTCNCDAISDPVNIFWRKLIL